MPEPTPDQDFDEFLEIRKPGHHLEEDVVADDFVSMLRVDLNNFQKFPKVDNTVTYPKANLDIRYELDADSGAELPDYSGPYRADLRYTDFSKEALASKLIPWSEAYMQLCVDGWAGEISKRFGAETMEEIEWTAWNEQTAPELERMRNEFLPAGAAYDYTDPNPAVPANERATTRIVYRGLFSPRLDMGGLPRSSWSPGSSDPTSSCCRPLRPGARRSSCATGSTRCSTSSSHCGATWSCRA